MTTMTLTVSESLDVEHAAAYRPFLASMSTDGVAMTSPNEPHSSTIYKVTQYIDTQKYGGGEPHARKWQLVGTDEGAGTATFSSRTSRFREAEKVSAFMAHEDNIGKKLTELFRERGGIVITPTGLEASFVAENPSLIGKIVDNDLMFWFRQGTNDKEDLSLILAYYVVAFPEEWEYWPGVFNVDRAAIAEKNPQGIPILEMAAAMLRGETDGAAGKAWDALTAAAAEMGKSATGAF